MVQPWWPEWAWYGPGSASSYVIIDHEPPSVFPIGVHLYWEKPPGTALVGLQSRVTDLVQNLVHKWYHICTRSVTMFFPRSAINWISGITDIILEVLNLGRVNFTLPTLLVSKIPLLVFHLCGCSRLCISMDAFSDLRMNAMSPSDPESNSTLQTLFGLEDSGVSLSWGMPAVAVA